MKRRGILTIALCAALAVAFLIGCLAVRKKAKDSAWGESETESTQRLVTSDGIVYGEVSAVGEETLTIKLGVLETTKSKEDTAGLKLAGWEVTIRTKEETVVESGRVEDTAVAESTDELPESVEESPETEDDIRMEDLEEGDIVSVALDEEGYARKITLMESPTSVRVSGMAE